MFNGILHYTTIKYFVITNANFNKQICKIRPPISNAARKQLGIDCENLRTKYKNEHLTSHDLHLDQVVMYQDSISKQWFPATKLSKEPTSYTITNKEGV